MDRRQQDLPCGRCGDVGREDPGDGYIYCQGCNTQLDIVTGDDFFLMDGGNAPHFTRNSQAAAGDVLTPEPLTIFRRFTQEDDAINASNIRVKTEKDDYSQYLDGIGPTEPVDFPSGEDDPNERPYESYYEEVRIKYVLGMQWMIQLQCEALVDKFNVRPLICGLASTVWLRFLASTGVFSEGWADSVVHQSESQRQGDMDERRKFNAIHRNEPRNAYGQRVVMLWFKRLRETIPLSCSLAISFLACHVAREAILPTDILKWSIEGKLPYFAAHVEIEKRIGKTSFCDISPSLMFRPSQTVPVQRLEKMAATIAESIGLHLPPVNFYEIASRYLKKLSVSFERVLPHACRIYEWSMPPDLWLSANELRLPTRVCVMSILIVAIRIMYNINGFGVWEKSLSNRNCSPSSSQHTNKLGSASSSETQGGAEKDEGSPLHKMVDDSSRDNLEIPSHGQTSHFNSTDLLNHLEATYNQIGVSCEFTKDLPSYLEYCKDVVFAGAGSSHVDHNEEDLIEKLWDFYQNEKVSEMEVEAAGTQNSSSFNQKRSRNDDRFFQTPVGKKEKREQWLESPSANISMDSAADSMENICISDNSHGDENLEQKNEEDSEERWKKKRIRQLKIDMLEDRFSYIPPRVKVKRLDYLHYVRKKDAGALSYAAHADYYILLRACARVAEIDIRNMHNAVLSFERRLNWLEKRIDVCSHLMLPSVSCEFCCRERNKFDDDPMTT